MNYFDEHPLQPFLEQLASDSPTPGGACAAAASGMLGASRLGLVCRITQNKRGYESVRDDIVSALKRCEGLREDLAHLSREDETAYTSLMAAFQLPRENDSQILVRKAALRSAWKDAVRSPLQIARVCQAVLDEAPEVTRLGSKSARSDAVVAAVLAEAGLRGSILTTRANLAGLSDPAAAARISHELDLMERRGRRTLEKVLASADFVQLNQTDVPQVVKSFAVSSAGNRP